MAAVAGMKRAPQLRPHQIVAANTWLAEHCVVLERNDKGYPIKCQYKSGDDGALAQHLGVERNQAERLRFKLYGALQKVRHQRPAGRAERITAQEKKLKQLAELVAQMAGELGNADIAVACRTLAGTQPTP